MALPQSTDDHAGVTSIFTANLSPLNDYPPTYPLGCIFTIYFLVHLILCCIFIRYASVTSVNTESNAIEVASKEPPPLSREEKRVAAKRKHEEEYPPPIDVSSNRAFELVSSLPQANEVSIMLTESSN